jgi:hypothetical protein
MSDLIFKTDGEENFRIPSPFSNNYYDLPKTPKTKLEVKKMTDIEKTEAEIKVLQKKLELLKEIETHKSQPKMTFDYGGKFEIVSYNYEEYLRLEFNDGSHNWSKRKHTVDGVVMVAITDGETLRLLEGVWFNDVKKGKYDDEVDEVEWDEKELTPNLQKIIDKMIEERKSQKLRNMLKVQLDFDIMVCDDIVSVVEDWLPDPQSAAGSQNVDKELLVDGFNDCLRKIKEMLR